MENNLEEAYELRVRPRPSQEVTLTIPNDALASLAKVASKQDTSVEALMGFYIGMGLREDLSKMFSQRVMESAAHVLAQHISSEEERAAILREIRCRAAE